MTTVKSTMIVTLILATPLWALEMNDPTQPYIPPTPAVQSAPSLRASTLRAIRVDARGNVATIDGHAVQVGDRIGEAKVKAIRPYEVVLMNAEGEQTLRLYPGVHKVIPAASKAPSHQLARKRKRDDVARGTTDVKQDGK